MRKLLENQNQTLRVNCIFYSDNYVYAYVYNILNLKQNKRHKKESYEDNFEVISIESCYSYFNLLVI